MNITKILQQDALTDTLSVIDDQLADLEQLSVDNGSPHLEEIQTFRKSFTNLSKRLKGEIL